MAKKRRVTRVLLSVKASTVREGFSWLLHVAIVAFMRHLFWSILVRDHDLNFMDRVTCISMVESRPLVIDLDESVGHAKWGQRE